MKTCIGSLNYIFSPYSITILKQLNLLPTNYTQSEKNGCMYYLVPLSLQSSTFNLIFCEIINEVEFLKNEGHSKSSSPELLEYNNFTQVPREENKSSYFLKSLIVEGTEPQTEFFREWNVLTPVTFANSEENYFYKTLSYKKKYPFWCLVLENTLPQNITNLQNDFTRIRWENKDAIWIQLETTSWDLLIYLN